MIVSAHSGHTAEENAVPSYVNPSTISPKMLGAGAFPPFSDDDVISPELAGSRRALLVFLEALGLNPTRVKSFSADSSHIEVVTYVEGSEGCVILNENGQIPVEYRWINFDWDTDS